MVKGLPTVGITRLGLIPGIIQMTTKKPQGDLTGVDGSGNTIVMTKNKNANKKICFW